MLRLTGNMLELALRRTGLLFTREALPDEMKRALEETATYSPSSSPSCRRR